MDWVCLKNVIQYRILLCFFAKKYLNVLWQEFFYERCGKVTDIEFGIIVDEIVAALKEKNYEPYEQILGYLKTDSEIYITRHNNARNKIVSLDKTKLKEYIERMTIS